MEWNFGKYGPGPFTYYTFQHSLRELSPWLNLTRLYSINEALTSEDPDIRNKIADEITRRTEWCFSCWEMFHFKPSGDSKILNECHDVWCKTKSYGLWERKSAMKCLKYVERQDAKGAHNSKDPYGAVCQLRRFDFRIVVVEYVPEKWRTE